MTTPSASLEPHAQDQVQSGLRTPKELLEEERANASLHNGDPDHQHGIQSVDAFRIGMAGIASQQSGVQAAPGEVTFRTKTTEEQRHEAEGGGGGYFGK